MLRSQDHAALWGVSPKRLLYFPRLARRDYYSLLSTSDLFLDTRNYNSHTVASDSMWGVRDHSPCTPCFCVRHAQSICPDPALLSHLLNGARNCAWYT